MDRPTSTPGPGTDAEVSSDTGQLDGKKKPASPAGKKGKRKPPPQIELNPTLKVFIEDAIERVRSLPVALREDAARELIQQLINKE